MYGTLPAPPVLGTLGLTAAPSAAAGMFAWLGWNLYDGVALSLLIGAGAALVWSVTRRRLRFGT